MIVASGIELRAGARLLLSEASFQVAEGDRIGLVGRNGAGKTTLCKVLSGAGQPAAGTVRRGGSVGYLPQDPRTGDLDVLALDRVLSARGVDELRAQMRAAEERMSDADPEIAERAIAQLRRDARLAPYLDLAVHRFLSVPDSKHAILADSPRLFLAIRIWLTEPQVSLSVCSHSRRDAPVGKPEACVREPINR